MAREFEDLCETLGMAEIIRLRDMLMQALTRRFERTLGLAFADVVGSTPYFSKFGDAAGRELQQRHVNLVAKASKPRGGRIVDTAGDGAFLCFESAEDAAWAMIDLQNQVFVDNLSREADHRLSVRVGVHYGPALTDGVSVTGDSVNFCSRIAGSSAAGQIRLSKPAFLALADPDLRIRCQLLAPELLKGLARPVEMFALFSRDTTLFPTSVRFETGEEIALPDQDTITFGRLTEQGGVKANDIVLSVPDPNATTQISRWHFELRRRLEGFVLAPVSNGLTSLDGKPVTKGEEVLVRPGAQVRVGDVLTLTFVSEDAMARIDQGATRIHRTLQL